MEEIKFQVKKWCHQNNRIQNQKSYQPRLKTKQRINIYKGSPIKYLTNLPLFPKPPQNFHSKEVHMCNNIPILQFA